MNPLEQIRAWLAKDAPYAEGLALYETYGPSRVVLKSLQYGETAFTRATLLRELKKLVAPAEAEQHQATPQKGTGQTGPAVAAGAVLPLNVPSSPASATKLTEHPERRTWYATRTHLHAQLELVATDRERLVLSQEILALSEKITASYAATVPAEPVPAPNLAGLDDAGEMRRQLANLRPQRTKLQKNPARAGDLARVVAAINLLEAKLKHRDGEPQLHPRYRNPA